MSLRNVLFALKIENGYHQFKYDHLMHICFDDPQISVEHDMVVKSA